jgi:PTS system fructose-specific IIC component
VFVFFAISNFLVFLLALALGAVVGAVAVTAAKSIGRPKDDDVPEDAVDLAHAHTAARPAGATAAGQPVRA